VAGLTFALDSNTFNDPLPLPGTEGDAARRQLENRRDELEQRNFKSSKPLPNLTTTSPTNLNKLTTWAKLQQVDELKIDVDKQLAADATTVTDFEQLDWLRQG